MESVVLVIHLILALAIIGLVLIQRSEGGGLGIGGGGGGLGGLATAKGTANALTKMTAICAAGFFTTSLLLGGLASKSSQQNIGLLEDVTPAQIEALAPVGGIDESHEGSAGVLYNPPAEMRDVMEDSPEAAENSPVDSLAPVAAPVDDTIGEDIDNQPSEDSAPEQEDVEGEKEGALQGNMQDLDQQSENEGLSAPVE
ncbi:MAG: preprotein translocase subunit SecG [Alphaproteobacteria bacterium]